jgi:DMSO/TMAO reductase YedYZ molybdopterin-dependent catalytic subunit
MHHAGRALLATHLGGQDLPIEHGGPVRLVVPGADCFTSVKWLDHLEFRVEARANTGREIALGRLRASRTSCRENVPAEASGLPENAGLRDDANLNDVLRIVTVNRQKSFQLALSFQGGPSDGIL